MGILKGDLGLAHAAGADQGEDLRTAGNLIEGFVKCIQVVFSASKIRIEVIWDTKKLIRKFRSTFHLMIFVAMIFRFPFRNEIVLEKT